MNELLRDRVLGIYDAVADPGLWPRVLQGVADDVNARGAIVFEWTHDGGARRLNAALMSEVYDAAAIETYLAKCFASESRDQDIFEAHSLRADGIDLIEDDVLAPDLDTLKALPNVAVLQKLGLLHRAAGLLNKDNVTQSRFSIQLGAERGRLEAEEKAYLHGVLPHIAKAMDLGRAARQVVRLHGALLAAMDRIRIGVCILDSQGRIAEANEEMRRQLERGQVFCSDPGGALRFHRTEDERRFDALKADAMAHGQFGARPRKEAIGTQTDGYLCIEVAPLHTLSELGTAPFDGYVLYSTDTARPFACQTAPVQAAFGLTEVELEVLEQIAQGLTNVQISQHRDRSVATVNAQVKSILSKTQCATRTQLVRLMMSFGADYLV